MSCIVPVLLGGVIRQRCPMCLEGLRESDIEELPVWPQVFDVTENANGREHWWCGNSVLPSMSQPAQHLHGLGNGGRAKRGSENDEINGVRARSEAVGNGYGDGGGGGGSEEGRLLVEVVVAGDGISRNSSGLIACGRLFAASSIDHHVEWLWPVEWGPDVCVGE